MSEEMTSEKALDIIQKLQGPEGLGTFSDELDKAIQGKKSQLAMLQGEIAAFTTVKRLLNTLQVRWGLTTPTQEGSRTATPAPPQEQTENPPSSPFDSEVTKRLKEGKCTYKARRSDGGKWCERTLSSKEEKACGYCEIHMGVVGIKPPETQEKKKSSRRKGNAKIAS